MSGVAASKIIENKPTSLRKLALVVGALFACFSVPLYQTARFGLTSDLYSHVLLIPFVSAYLIWIQRDRFVPSGLRVSQFWVAGCMIAGSGFALLYLSNLLSTVRSPPQDTLAYGIYSLVFFLGGACCGFFDRSVVRAAAFPLAFLLFMAPFPTGFELHFETFLQHGSSVVAQAFFEMIGTPVYREGTLFHLPGFNMQVAPECSGIHSTVALFITSLVAGQVLLRSNWSRAALALVVLPIALLRNGLRVTTIGELCVRIGPEMIDSYIHRHGGPIFFAISLLPFSLVLFLLLKIDQKNRPQSSQSARHVS